MPLIDSNGLADGDRINSCSKMAQLYYPRMMAASNGYGRIRIDYRQIVASVFPKWSDADLPGEPELLGYFQEYAHNRLIFLYSSAGQLWGQWDAKAGTFGKYQTVADKRSPVPPEKEFGAWIKDNREHSQKESVAMAHFELVIPEEKLPQGKKKLRQNSAKLPHGVGVGVGDGVTCDVLGVGVKPSSRSASTDALFEKAYEQYPRHIGKRAASTSWTNAVNRAWGANEAMERRQAEDMVYQRVMTYAAACDRARTEKKFIPHMATWLNQDRFLDDPSEWAVTKGAGNVTGNSKAQRVQDESLDAIRTAVSRINGRAPGATESSVPQPERDGRNGGIVLDGTSVDPPRSRAAAAGNGSKGGDA